MVFHNCEYISIEGLDQLVVEFKVRDAFLSRDSGEPVYNEGYKIYQKIRK